MGVIQGDGNLRKVNGLLKQKDYWENIEKIRHFEQDRQYCRHDMHHFLDVARIGYLYTLENQLPFQKETIYAIGLLHDIGKWMQYQQGIPHEKASKTLAFPLLENAGFSPFEIEEICLAIKNHRKYQSPDNSLSYVTWLADKKSRQCFCCTMLEQCNWSNEKKNLIVTL